MKIFNLLVLLTLSYLIGSIPFGYLAGRILKGIDIRKHGSGNVGATNVFRVVGKLPGICVLLLDAAKGYVVVALLGEGVFKILLGMVCVLGHNWTIFLKFKGGKGVAATIGVMLGLAPAPIACGVLVWLFVFVLSRYVSLSSIISAVSIPIFSILFGERKEIVILVAVLSLLIIYRHRSNIRRLIRGEEPRLAVFGKK